MFQQNLPQEDSPYPGDGHYPLEENLYGRSEEDRPDLESSNQDAETDQ